MSLTTLLLMLFAAPGSASPTSTQTASPTRSAALTLSSTATVSARTLSATVSARTLSATVSARTLSPTATSSRSAVSRTATSSSSSVASLTRSAASTLTSTRTNATAASNSSSATNSSTFTFTPSHTPNATGNATIGPTGSVNSATGTPSPSRTPSLSPSLSPSPSNASLANATATFTASPKPPPPPAAAAADGLSPGAAAGVAVGVLALVGLAVFATLPAALLVPLCGTRSRWWCCCGGGGGGGSGGALSKSGRSPFSAREQAPVVLHNPYAAAMGAGIGGGGPALQLPTAPPPGAPPVLSAPPAFLPLAPLPLPAGVQQHRPAGAHHPAGGALPAAITSAAQVVALSRIAADNAATAAREHHADPAAAAYARSFGYAARSFAAADRGARAAGVVRLWQGRAALSEVDAALLLQRRWKAFRARTLMKQWVKITAFDGDVFYKSKATGELAWDIPSLPAITLADRAAAAHRAAVEAVAGETVHLEPATGDSFVVREGRFFFLERASRRPMAEGMRQVRDDTDEWFVTKGGEAVWEPQWA